MAERGHHDKIFAEILSDGFRLRRTLDDDE